jgi:thiol-disulfide isomerase/thioredoxin
MNLIPRVTLSIFTLLLPIILVSCSRDHSATPSKPAVSNVSELTSVSPRENRIANFSWKDSTGKTVDFDSFRGKVTLINVWATWCGPCRKELPDLIALHGEFSGRGVKMIGISQDRISNAVEEVRSFVKEHGIPYQVVMSNDDLETAFKNVRMLPTTFIVNDSGAIVQTFIGAQTKETFSQALLAALK